VKLVDTDEDRPDDDDGPAPAVRPPRPEKRQAMVSLVLTMTILIGTVVAIYTVFPARNNEIMSVATSNHRKPEQAWQLVAPGGTELSAWALALLGNYPPLPDADQGLTIVGARPVEVLHRKAAFVGYVVDGDPVSYLVQRAHDAPPRRVSRRDGDDVVESWRSGAWTCVAVGPATSADRWRAQLGVP
jgi:hypothetical protein